MATNNLMGFTSGSEDESFPSTGDRGVSTQEGVGQRRDWDDPRESRQKVGRGDGGAREPKNAVHDSLPVLQREGDKGGMRNRREGFYIPKREGETHGVGNGQGNLRMGARKSIVKIDTFSGKITENVSDFRENFFRASVINEWSPQIQTLILPSYLEGRARDVFNNMGPETKASTSAIFEMLELTFNSSAVRYQAKAQLLDRVQKPNESVADYHANLSGLCRKAWSNVDRGEERAKLVEYFVHGLRPQIRKIFFDKEPATIEVALREAEGREIYLRSKAKGLASINAVDKEGGVKKVKWEDSQAGVVDSLRKELEGLKDKLAQRDGQIEAMDKKMRALMEDASRTAREAETPQRGGRSFSPRRENPPSCWGCGATTHFRAECPNKGGK
jgi:hypothetical protein